MRSRSDIAVQEDDTFPYGLVYGLVGAVCGLAGVWLSTALSFTHAFGA